MTYTWLPHKHSIPGPHLLLLGSSPSPTFLFLCQRMEAWDWGKKAGRLQAGEPICPLQLSPCIAQWSLEWGRDAGGESPGEEDPPHATGLLSYKGKCTSPFLQPSPAPPGVLRVSVAGLPPPAAGNV